MAPALYRKLRRRAMSMPLRRLTECRMRGQASRQWRLFQLRRRRLWRVIRLTRRSLSQAP